MWRKAQRGCPALPQVSLCCCALPADTRRQPSICQAVSSSVLLQVDDSLACRASLGLLHFHVFHRLTWLSIAWSKGLEQLVLLQIVLWSKPWIVMLPAFVLVKTQSKAHWNQILLFYWLYSLDWAFTGICSASLRNRVSSVLPDNLCYASAHCWCSVDTDRFW